MRQTQSLHRLLLFGASVVFLFSVSLIGDDRPEWRTNGIQSQVRDGRIGSWDLQGTIVSVNPNGDAFVLRTGGRRILINARGGVVAIYRGRRYRIRDLERGDRVAVDLVSTRGRYPRARVVEVLSSVSHDGYRRDDRYRRNDRYDDRYGRGRYERLSGQVLSLDYRRELMIIRTDSNYQVTIDTRGLALGRYDARRSIREGDWIEVEGYYSGRTFRAERFSNRDDRYRDDDYDRDRDWRDDD